MEDLISLLLWFFVDVLLIRTGRVVVTVASGGRWRGEDRARNEARLHGPAGALSFAHRGQRVVTLTGLALAGAAFYLGILCIALAMAAAR